MIGGSEGAARRRGGVGEVRILSYLPIGDGALSLRQVLDHEARGVGRLCYVLFLVALTAGIRIGFHPVGLQKVVGSHKQL